MKKKNQKFPSKLRSLRKKKHTKSRKYEQTQNSKKPKNRESNELRSLPKDNQKSNPKSDQSKIRISALADRATEKATVKTVNNQTSVVF